MGIYEDQDGHNVKCDRSSRRKKRPMNMAITSTGDHCECVIVKGWIGSDIQETQGTDYSPRVQQ